MPRARNIKPSFFKDAKVVSCSHSARLCFIGLWTLADYTGRLKYEPLEIKMEIFPADDVNVEMLIQELLDAGLIDIYQAIEKYNIIHVNNFTKHQNPHKNERTDKSGNPMPHLPARDYSGSARDYSRAVRERSDSARADSLLLIPDSCFLNPEPTQPSAREGVSTGYISICPETGEILETAGGAK